MTSKMTQDLEAITFQVLLVQKCETNYSIFLLFYLNILSLFFLITLLFFFLYYYLYGREKKSLNKQIR